MTINLTPKEVKDSAVIDGILHDAMGYYIKACVRLGYHRLILHLDRGGLKYPKTIILYRYKICYRSVGPHDKNTGATWYPPIE
jgi:hypothetical protein